MERKERRKRRGTGTGTGIWNMECGAEYGKGTTALS